MHPARAELPVKTVRSREAVRQNFDSLSRFAFLLFLSPSAVLTNAVYLCSHTDSASRMSHIADGKFGVIFTIYATPATSRSSGRCSRGSGICP